MLQYAEGGDTVKITITLDNHNQVHTQLSKSVSIPVYINTCLTSILATMNQAVAAAPPELRQQLKEHLFDSFNEAASSLLASFAPDIDLRPDITEEAILQLELQLANDKLS